MKVIDKIRRLLNYERQIKQQNSRLLYLLRAENLTQKTLNSKESGVSSERLCESEVIVSLTSFGKRIMEVYLTIESIMQGTIKPNKIILWLAEEYKVKPLPTMLQKQQKRGLEIQYCRDIRSYKKLIPSLEKHPDSVIITIDDDVIYNYDVIENLINTHKMYSKDICANRVHRVRLDPNGIPMPYMSWGWEYANEDSSALNFFTGVGGVLYPPNCFVSEVFNEKVYFDICKYADDIWFYAMALKAGTKIRKSYTHSSNSQDYLENESVQDVGLYNSNLGENTNDVQLRAVFDKYNLYAKLV